MLYECASIKVWIWMTKSLCLEHVTPFIGIFSFKVVYILSVSAVIIIITLSCFEDDNGFHNLPHMVA